MPKVHSIEAGNLLFAAGRLEFLTCRNPRNTLTKITMSVLFLLSLPTHDPPTLCHCSSPSGILRAAKRHGVCERRHNFVSNLKDFELIHIDGIDGRPLSRRAGQWNANAGPDGCTSPVLMSDGIGDSMAFSFSGEVHGTDRRRVVLTRVQGIAIYVFGLCVQWQGDNGISQTLNINVDSTQTTTFREIACPSGTATCDSLFFAQSGLAPGITHTINIVNGVAGSGNKSLASLQYFVCVLYLVGLRLDLTFLFA